MTALGYALGTWAMVVNARFTKIVRVDDGTDHPIATSGPYRIVRHPAYLGQVVAAIATPLMLGSLCALIGGATMAALFVARAALEDRGLRAEPARYREYADEVGSRLVPSVW